MTEQEIFDKVWKHLNKQGVKSASHNYCEYRTESGLACAVGCLLDDETAHILDNFDVSSIRNIYRKQKNIIPEELHTHIEFLEELQYAHDTSGDTAWGAWLTEWQDAMRKIAKQHKLTIPRKTL